MIRKSLVVLLVLFFVLSGVSWGIERVVGGGKVRKVAISVALTSGVSADDFVSGLYYYNGSPKDFGNGLSVGLGYSENFSSRLFWEFNFRYYYYYERSQLEPLAWYYWNLYLKSHIFEYNFTLKSYFFSVFRKPTVNPYMGIGASLVYDVFKYEMIDIIREPVGSGKEDKFLPAFTGCFGLDINPTDKETFFFDVNLLWDLRSVVVESGTNTSLNASNVRIGLGFARRF
jgi:hypothetical protein